MKTLFMAIGLLYVAAAAIPCYAENDFKDGNDLLHNCSIALNIIDKTDKDFDDVEAVKGGLCLGFMHGITDLNQVYKYKADNDPLFCFPKDGTNTQAARVVVKYLKDHPEKLHEHMTLLTVLAFKEAFPCKK